MGFQFHFWNRPISKFGLIHSERQQTKEKDSDRKEVTIQNKTNKAGGIFRDSFVFFMDSTIPAP